MTRSHTDTYYIGDSNVNFVGNNKLCWGCPSLEARYLSLFRVLGVRNTTNKVMQFLDQVDLNQFKSGSSMSSCLQRLVDMYI